MKKWTLWMMVLMLFGGMTVEAAVVNLEKAKQTASNFMNARIEKRQIAGQTVRRAPAAPQQLEAKVLFDAKDQEGNPYLYAVSFPKEGGFVLVSGDDRFVPVLGYSETGSLSESDMPENMRSWLQGYIEEIKYLESIDYMPVYATQTKGAKPAIEPMVETRWNQGAPYNALCPYDTDNNQCVTGCVATAMAQVMNYHIQHFDAPTSIIADIPAYTTREHELKVTGIPAGTPIPNKSLLRNVYDDNATDEEKEAVAQLMLYCGVSIEMNYTSAASGAYTDDAAAALVKYFGFDRTTTCYYRNKYTYATWIEMMYGELASARPVLFAGSTATSGHAFVLDGYDGDDLFHVNWGWGGSSDNYFALSVLDPNDNSQIGASTSSGGFSGSQRAVFTQIIGVEPEPEPVGMDMYWNSVDGSTVTFTAWNHTGEAALFDVGIACYHDEDGTISDASYYSMKDWTEPLQDGQGGTLTATIDVDADLANTTRKFILISRLVDTEPWHLQSDIEISYLGVQYDENGNPALSLHPIDDLVSGGVTITSSTFVQEEQIVHLAVTNKGDEHYGYLFLFASQTDEKGDYASKNGVTVLKGEETQIDFAWTPQETGTYKIWISLDDKGVSVLDSTRVTIVENPLVTAGTRLMATNVAFAGQDNSTLVIDPATGQREVTVYADELRGVVTLTNITDEDIPLHFLQILFDKWNGEAYEPDPWTKGWSSSIISTFYANWQAGFRITGATAETENTYRMRVIDKENDESIVTFDEHYIIHLRHAKKSLTDEDITISEIEDQEYTGEPITPVISIKDGEKDVTEHFDFHFADNIEVGLASVTITAKAESPDYTGRKYILFSIVNSEAGIASPNTEKGQVEKVILDGQLLILRDKKTYNILGVPVK